MAGKNPKPETEADSERDADNPDSGVNPVGVALDRMRRSGRWRFVIAILLAVLMASGLGFEVFRLNGEVAGMTARLEAMIARQDTGLARIQDQTASMRAGVELQREDIGQIKRQLDSLMRR